MLWSRRGRKSNANRAWVKLFVAVPRHCTPTQKRVCGAKAPIPCCLVRAKVSARQGRDTLVTRANRAYLQGELGDATGAVAELEEVLADCVRVLGPEHRDTLFTRSNLARTRGEAGDAAGAVVALEEVLADRLRVLDPDHPHTLTTRRELAFWHRQAGNSSDADPT
jgi:hypothetical protein